MNIFFDDKDKNELGKLIHVGAGVGTEVNEYASQGFTEILLLEPIPKVFNQLVRKVAKLEKLNTKCKILALNVALSGKTEKSKEDVFYITMPTRYSSFHKTDKLKALFQNLKTEQETSVDTLSFSNLLEKEILDKNKDNALVLQINGAEFNVLQQANENELMLFSSIVIQQSKNNYFENTKGSAELIKLMKSKGFQLAKDNSSDVVFSHLTFRKDENVFKLKALNENNQIQATRIKDLENQLSTSSEIKTNEVNKVAEQSKKQVMRIEELENQINASNEAKANDVNKVAEQSKKQTMRIEELENQINVSNEAKVNDANKVAEQSKKQAMRIEELENQINASNEAKASDTNKVAEQSKKQAMRIEELENQINASNEAKVNDVNKVVEKSKKQAARIEELENTTKKIEDEVIKLSIENELITKERDIQAEHHKKNKDWAESLKLQIAKLTADLEEKSRSAILGQKMLAKAQIDLDNLRESYSEKVKVESELVDLVKELRDKLVMASKYYQQLQQEHPEILMVSDNIAGN